MNAYSYVDNQAINYIDPDGREKVFPYVPPGPLVSAQAARVQVIEYIAEDKYERIVTKDAHGNPRISRGLRRTLNTKLSTLTTVHAGNTMALVNTPENIAAFKKYNASKARGL